MALALVAAGADKDAKIVVNNDHEEVVKQLLPAGVPEDAINKVWEGRVEERRQGGAHGQHAPLYVMFDCVL